MPTCWVTHLFAPFSMVYQELLLELAAAAKLQEKMNAMKNGDHINRTENRAVLHTALRCPKTERRIVDGVDVVPEVHAVLEKIAIFSEKVRKGEWIGATGKKLTTVVAIGIGGSFLGPEFVYEALKTEKDGEPQLHIYKLAIR